ncbi:MAG: hypothetical protein A2X13_07895 [Bacteroidetes bacterium GWC2_33_15]|nr:MAG: hypothetical protein A2X10_04950 [Bacteroidetes bacterium GWA2_33_15]OFX52672.1 MAG: hypothetical protein A2X13_07895 [Bacteroidetes bacterium GWC2_33_15]OFX64022.1 MAG: hypothetical protein A2X15_02440 [Bacteroidetes bacterium GWB2_32_14]OFX67293.1 MAG: hypothetical protein A2X14_11975 [Bacteroidetes bacterium GWD2_33_33]HAN18847.1 hypothetical protein [Bacteroidales bacterium]
MIKKILTIVLVLNLSISVFAQKRFDIFSASGNYNFIETESGNHSKNYEAAFMSNLNLPIVLKDSSIWYSSLDYQYFAVNNTFSSAYPDFESFRLHGFIFKTGLIYRFNSKEFLQILFSPRYMSDFNASFSKSVQLGGLIMYERVKNENFTYRLGVMYNQEFFGTYIVPVFYLDWNLGRNIKINGLIPIYGKVFYQPSQNFSTGLHFIGLTTTYRINEENYKNYYIDRRSIDLSWFSNVHVWDNFFLEGRLGYSLSKDYGLFEEDDKITLGLPLVNIGDDRTRQNSEFEPSMFVHLKLVYSLPVK